MNTLNRHRLRILVRHFVHFDSILSVKRTNLQEPLFSDYFNFWPKVELKFGKSIADVTSQVFFIFESLNLFFKIKLFQIRIFMSDQNTYGLGVKSAGTRYSVVLVLKRDLTVEDMIEAAFLAFIVEMELIRVAGPVDVNTLLENSKMFCRKNFQTFLAGLKSSGWDLSHCLLAFGDWRIHSK